MDINGVASLLDDEHIARLTECWHLLETRCGMKGKNTDLPPHFTWQMVARYDLTQFEPLIRALAWATQPFTVRTSGLGIFSGRSPILYINIIKDSQLLHLHEQIWRYSQCCAVKPSLYYSPTNWVPHITLFSDSNTTENFCCALELLAFEPFEWELPVDNLALLCPDQNASETYNLIRIPFGKR
jgi:2'-5' RNA ligase